MNGPEIAVIISAGAQVMALVVGIGRLTGKLDQIADDMKESRKELSDCLRTLLLMRSPGNPGGTSTKEAH
jgi:chloramphenicol 3-O-phosphotransferase